VGTIGVCAGALIFFPTGHLLIGVLVVTAFVFSDLVDGHMARLSGQSSKWGAFLDSTLDRFGDAAIFAGLAMYYIGPGDDNRLAALSIYCLVLGSITSYARARAESLGMEAKGGIAERADRLVSILVMTGLAALFDVPILIPITLSVLALASTITVVQRILTVRAQAKAAA
jgi:CDP-diacylglycerol--glycerol-3-phosphate 3-phosphatidyltransferase/CDP-diacylglycerol--inositol 3-phosphatidyltransferase